MSEETCVKCRKTKKALMTKEAHPVTTFFHGKHFKTNKPMMICGRCFAQHYEVVPGKGENFFREKTEGS